MTGSSVVAGLRHPVASTRIFRRYGATLATAVGLAGLWWPEHIALVRQGESISCAQLAAAVERSSASLAERYPAGTRIGVRSDGGIGTVVLLAAAIGAGLDVIPLGPRLGEADTEAVVRRERLAEVLSADELAQSSTIVPRSEGAARRPGRLVLLTTGSTGLPKAQQRGSVSLRMLRSLRDLDRRIRWPRGPVLVLAPIDHGHGLSAVLSALLAGRTALLGAGLAPDALAADVALTPPASVTGVPLQLATVIDSGMLDAAPLRRIVSGSSRLDDALAERLVARTGASLIDCLGTTETGTFAVREPPAPFRRVAGMRLRVDAEGFLRVRSPFARGWMRTGDAGRLVRGGLVITGRGDGLVDAAGELVSTERIRETTLALPGVRSCATETIDDELRGSAVLVRVEVDDPDLARPGALRELLIPVLGRSGIPHRIDVSVVAGAE